MAAGDPTHPAWARALLSRADLEAVGVAVARAERRTSGEIRVHLEERLPRTLFGRPRDPLARARRVFALLDLHCTAERNGVLIYLAVRDRRLAIVGDEGVHARLGPEGWARIRDGMVERLRAEAAREALEEAVAAVGEVLAEHFPRRSDDVNELGNDVSFA